MDWQGEDVFTLANSDTSPTLRTNSLVVLNTILAFSGGFLAQEHHSTIFWLTAVMDHHNWSSFRPV